MVVPIRDQGNITHFSTTMSSNSLYLIPGQDINIDTDPIKAMFNLDNNLNKMRDHLLNLSIYRPRSPSLSSSECDEEYHIRVKQESNRMDEDKLVNSSSDFSLEYTTQVGQNNQVSKAADSTHNTRMQYAPTAGPAFNQPSSENIFNI